MTQNKNNRKAQDKPRLPLTVTRPELIINGSDDSFRELVHASLAFASRLQSVREGYAEIIGLTGPQYTILISVGHLHNHGKLGVKKLAEHLCQSGTFVTTEVNKLVSAGLVRKDKDKNDGRRVNLTTTKKAQSLLSKLSKIQQEVNDVHFGNLSAEEFSSLRKIMFELVSSTDLALSLLRHLGAAHKLNLGNDE
ncbi:MAG: MarR family transcriptional regulator [Emcibacteraceae bacterium]|nr:MarR family transcriptional regulator [Emcibacteraceae bacterium]